MPQQYQSEIRDSTIRDLLTKVKSANFGSYLRKMTLTKIRAFEGEVVDFEFPVTALIAANGGGKSSILGAAALAYKNKLPDRNTKPAIFFPKSSLGDDSMANWGASFEVIEKTKNPTQLIPKSARFKNAKWAREDVLERPVIYFGITRTVPAGERSEFKKIATTRYRHSGRRINLSVEIIDHVAKILGKDISYFQMTKLNSGKDFYIGGDGKISYSEFHFGAGESSVIRMVSEIESAPKNSLVLIEEIENGLHPVAVRRMVEYLIDAADRRSVQTIFTTHSEDALLPLPSEGIWYSIEGKVRQGRISIDALRAMTGRVEEGLAIFVEDDFAKEIVENIIRRHLTDIFDRIGVYAVSGQTQAHAIHMHHMRDPSVNTKIKSLCILDGDSLIDTDPDSNVIKLPGKVPEAEVFDYVHEHIDTLSMLLAAGLHLPPEKDEFIKKVVKEVALTNRDPHLLFNQVGQKAGLIASAIVSSAFINLWFSGKQKEMEEIATKIRSALTE
ncbi:MAG: ATP-binding protein [Methylobacterium sp.]|uniref:ATP-dependent nuclease n=1 Tax=Methylobacterium sp. TaxID=409 RepID=UPI0025870421|nr:AAA family ATPase [Methylobacterium sp.]MBY0295656.1 ATP-binding protein [Methylobacterium sp.]